MGDLVYEPPRDGPTLWEIGFPDRSAAEFFIPDPNPIYINKFLLDAPNRLVHLLIIKHEKVLFDTKNIDGTGLDNMGCGTDIQSCTPMEI